jgi:L-alanine-DL-glutamate epimerase-like enolase superfamily enzyme
MKITRVTTRLLRTPADNELAPEIDAAGATREFVSVEVDTDAGLQGIGITFFGGPLTVALKDAVDALGALTIGEDPLQVAALAGKLQRAIGGAGPGGLATLALSALDIAMWDIKGKALGQTVSSLVGGYRDRAPAYASGALLRPYPTKYLAENGARLAAKGFKAMKTQLGSEPSVVAAVDRIRALRETVGDDIDLMCDINQLWSVNQAIEIGTRLAPFHLFWLEDVCAHDDFQGLSRVADALTTPVCAGEYHYGIRPFRHMLEARSIDIVMIDLLRVGGITQWLKVAGMAEAFNLPVVSHLIPEIHCHLIAGIPNGLTVEYMPWTLRFFEETPKVEDGQIVVPDKPGLGLTFDKDALTRYEVV